MADIWIEDTLENDGLWICGFNPEKCEAWEFVQFENYTHARRQCQNDKLRGGRFCAADIQFRPEKYQELLTIKPPVHVVRPIERPTEVFYWNPPIVPRPRPRVTKRQAKVLDKIIDAPVCPEEAAELTAYELAVGISRSDRRDRGSGLPTPQVFGMIELSPADRWQRNLVRKGLRRRRYPREYLPLVKVMIGPRKVNRFIERSASRITAAATINMLVGLGIVA